MFTRGLCRTRASLTRVLALSCRTWVTASRPDMHLRAARHAHDRLRSKRGRCIALPSCPTFLEVFTYRLPPLICRPRVAGAAPCLGVFCPLTPTPAPASQTRPSRDSQRHTRSGHVEHQRCSRSSQVDGVSICTAFSMSVSRPAYSRSPPPAATPRRAGRHPLRVAGRCAKL